MLVFGLSWPRLLLGPQTNIASGPDFGGSPHQERFRLFRAVALEQPGRRGGVLHHRSAAFGPVLLGQGAMMVANDARP